jgi:hypothetical protein
MSGNTLQTWPLRKRMLTVLSHCLPHNNILHVRVTLITSDLHLGGGPHGELSVHVHRGGASFHQQHKHVP